MQMNMSVELWWNDTHRNKEMWRLKLISAIAYLKIQFLPRSKHTPRLENRYVIAVCIGKESSLFWDPYKTPTCTVWAERQWSKCLCAPDDYSTKNTQKYFKLVSITYHDNVVRIRDNRWR
jgi:hypothetical protein